ncbi:YcgN family cysteine cluster protein [Methylomonas paludis]|uniref:UPF0260 protein KEF85_13850 n=1 Tax=Methylomonas paludis TaxID=1173101 RepID=A0A975MM95_9GAMM|nr:YcgN family cysteine cluster protein [Methylomonas paludis]QWF70407.1 YcgN family cysteine cluster protein [Methylomonas paludis]
MNFWETKSLAEMSTAEWESLCDNCGKCCLHKLEDEDSGEIAVTRVVCELIDLDSCRCTRYSERCTLVPECLDLKQHDFSGYKWLPDTCAYRLLTIGEPLPVWHPLISKDPDSVRKAGVSIRSYAIKESQVEDMEDHIIGWIK